MNIANNTGLASSEGRATKIKGSGREHRLESALERIDMDRWRKAERTLKVSSRHDQGTRVRWSVLAQVPMLQLWENLPLF